MPYQQAQAEIAQNAAVGPSEDLKTLTTFSRGLKSAFAGPTGKSWRQVGGEYWNVAKVSYSDGDTAFDVLGRNGQRVRIPSPERLANLDSDQHAELAGALRAKFPFAFSPGKQSSSKSDLELQQFFLAGKDSKPIVISSSEALLTLADAKFLTAYEDPISIGRIGDPATGKPVFLREFNRPSVILKPSNLIDLQLSEQIKELVPGLTIDRSGIKAALYLSISSDQLHRIASPVMRDFSVRPAIGCCSGRVESTAEQISPEEQDLFDKRSTLERLKSFAVGIRKNTPSSLKQFALPQDFETRLMKTVRDPKVLEDFFHYSTVRDHENVAWLLERIDPKFSAEAQKTLSKMGYPVTEGEPIAVTFEKSPDETVKRYTAEENRRIAAAEQVRLREEEERKRNWRRIEEEDKLFRLADEERTKLKREEERLAIIEANKFLGPKLKQFLAEQLGNRFGERMLELCKSDEPHLDLVREGLLKNRPDDILSFAKIYFGENQKELAFAIDNNILVPRISSFGSRDMINLVVNLDELSKVPNKPSSINNRLRVYNLAGGTENPFNIILVLPDQNMGKLVAGDGKQFDITFGNLHREKQ